MLNPTLLSMALKTIQKTAFVPSDAAAGGGQGGPPPVDPGAAGGAPPGPPDPSQGMPPDAGAGGGAAPPPPPGPDPSGAQSGGMDPASIAGQVAMGVQTAMAQSGMQGQGGKIGPNGKPQVKPDINTIATDVFQLKKMLFAIMRHGQIELPPDVLDGPNRDPNTGAPAESPTGGSDVPPGASMGNSAIKPVQPMQGAFPSAPGGDSGGGAGPTMGKISSANEEAYRVGQAISGTSIMSKAAAVAMMIRRRKTG